MSGDPDRDKRAKRGLPRWVLPVAIVVVVLLVMAALAGNRGGGLNLGLPALIVIVALVVVFGVQVRRGRVASPTHDEQAPVGRRERRRAFPVRLAFLGFLLVPASAVVGLAAGNATGVFGVLPLVIIAVVA